MGSLKNSRPKACHRALNPWQPFYWHSLQFLNNRDQDEEEKKEQHDLRKEQRHTRLLAAVMTRPKLAPGHPKSTPRGPPPGKGAGFSCGSPEHWSKDCSGSKSQSTPQKSCLFAKKMGCWKREGPQLLRKRGNSPTPVMATGDWQDLGTSKTPQKTVIITREEPWITTDLGGKLSQI